MAKKSNYSQHDIYAVLMAASQGTSPNPYHLFIIDLPEGDPDLELADSLLIRRPVAEAAHA